MTRTSCTKMIITISLSSQKRKWSCMVCGGEGVDFLYLFFYVHLQNILVIFKIMFFRIENLVSTV